MPLRVLAAVHQHAHHFGTMQAVGLLRQDQLRGADHAAIAFGNEQDALPAWQPGLQFHGQHARAVTISSGGIKPTDAPLFTASHSRSAKASSVFVSMRLIDSITGRLLR